MSHNRRPLVPPHHSTSSSLRVMNPFSVSRFPYFGGILQGCDQFGRPIVFEDNGLVSAGVISSSGKITIGKTGSRKSGGEKLNVLRGQGLMRDGHPLSQMVFSRKKNEYKGLLDATGGNSIDFGADTNGVAACINILDLFMLGGATRDGQAAAFPAQQQLAAQAFGDLQGFPLTNIERDMLRIGLGKTNADPGPRGIATIPRLAEHLMHPNEYDAKVLGGDHTVSSMHADTKNLLSLVRRFCPGGDAGGYLDGLTNMDFRTNSGLTVVDFSAIRKHMRGIVMGALITQLRAAWDRGDPNYIVHKVTFEECWDYFSYLRFGEDAQEAQKLHRQTAKDFHYIFHSLSDPQAAGDDGSRAVKLAALLASDTHIRQIYHVDENEIDRVQKSFGLTDPEAELVLGFDPGWRLCKIGKYSPIINGTTVDPFELAVVYTNEAVDLAAA